MIPHPMHSSQHLKFISGALLLVALWVGAACCQEPPTPPQSIQSPTEEVQPPAPPELRDDFAAETERKESTAPMPPAPPLEIEEANEPDFQQVPSNQAPGEIRLRFSFKGARWQEVLDWLAEAGNLAIYVDDVPQGSFTYSDSQYFTLDEAITRLNLFLLPRGYTLVRRGELLSVINLGDPRGLQQLDSMAETVLVADLEPLNPHEVVKCFVPLGEIAAADVLDELKPLSLMTSPVVLPKSNQLIITDTARKLRSAVEVIAAMQEPREEEVLRRFDLEYVDAETVLMVARTHLGIPEEDTVGVDISITTDLTGKRLFAIGSQEKVSRLEKLLEALDVPRDTPGDVQEKSLVSYPVQGGNLRTIHDVLQTMLSDRSLRLSAEEATESIIALADAETHAVIQQTIEELSAPEVEFSVVELGPVDPYFAVSLITEMFDLNPQEPEDRRRDDDDEEPAIRTPKVDADPGNRRLFVRGTKNQIAQIETLVGRLGARTGDDQGVRLIPLTSRQRDRVLRAAQQTWPGANRLMIAPSDVAEPEIIERAIHEDRSTQADRESLDQPDADLRAHRPFPGSRFGQPPSDESHLLSAQRFASTDQDAGLSTPTAHDSVPPIRGELVPGGIVVASDDVKALDAFEDHLQQLKAASREAVSPPVVYYLKYVSAETAVSMLADLLDGGNALTDTESGSLVSGSTSSDTYFGSFLFERDGMSTVTAGTATIVADARLNRLIVQGTEEDIETIDRYLKIVDKDSSLTQIETFGQTHVIPLENTKAEEVAEMIRKAFPNRVEEDKAQVAARMAAQQKANPKDDSKAPRVDENPTRGREPKMAVAVHEASNSLVITAPEALFREVEMLVLSIDRRSEQAVQVISAGVGIDQETIQRILDQELGTSKRPSTSRK